MLSEDLDRLERQVAEDKKELNILIAQIRDGQYYGNPVDDPVMKNRIRNIQDNLYYLEAQLDIARREFEKPKPAAQNIYAPNPFEPQPQPVQQPVQQPQPAKPQEPVMTMDTLTNADYIQTYTPPQEKTPQKELNIFANQNINPQTANNIPPDLPYTKPQKASSTEEIFGKKVMAIAASGLIFISIILFAIVFVPALGTPAKIFMMFAVSFAASTKPCRDAEWGRYSYLFSYAIFTLKYWEMWVFTASLSYGRAVPCSFRKGMNPGCTPSSGRLE